MANLTLRPMLAAALGCDLASCAAPATRLPPAPEIAATVVTNDRYPALRASFSGGVIGLPDLVYREAPGYRPLTLDLYLPPRRSALPEAPLVLFVHGGAWRSGHSRAAGAFEDFPSVLASMAARGFVVASVNYRLSGEAPFPAASEDVRVALQFLRENGARFGIDGRRVILWGASAGAHLAALVATQCRGSVPSPSAAPDNGCVSGVVAWYGIFDLGTLEAPEQAAASPTAAFLGCNPRECEALATQASPITHVARGSPPFLLLHGLADQMVAPVQSRAMESRLRAAGASVQTEYLQGVGHSWIGATAGDTRQATLTALDRTIRFIEAETHPRP